MILWRRLDTPGLEVAQVRGNRITGTAIFVFEKQPVKLEYSVDCDREWRTISARVAGFIGNLPVHHTIDAEEGTWRMDGSMAPQVDGCLDIDLNFSPSTNLLPIRRCAPEVGEETSVTAAWLRFPSFRLEPLTQTYRRVSESKYVYRSPSFTAELEVDHDGLVLRYANIWACEERS
jgi:hypothetical protein